MGARRPAALREPFENGSGSRAAAFVRIEARLAGHASEVARRRVERQAELRTKRDQCRFRGKSAAKRSPEPLRLISSAARWRRRTAAAVSESFIAVILPFATLASTPPASTVSRNPANAPIANALGLIRRQHRILPGESVTLGDQRRAFDGIVFDGHLLGGRRRGASSENGEQDENVAAARSS